KATKLFFSKSNRHNVVGVVSICSFTEKRAVGFNRFRNVQLTFEDSCDLVDGPVEHDVSRILSFGATFNEHFINPDLGTLLVFHCYAGASRSTAAAVLCFAQALGEGNEDEAYVKAKASQETKNFRPNRLMIE